MPAHNPEYVKKIGELIKQGKTNPEIAQELGRTSANINNHARRYFGGNPNYMKAKTKHKHLRGDVMLYFLTHSTKETMEKFKLTASEFKSCMTVGYRSEEYKHLRKETRRHDKWTGEEKITLLRYCGILRRSKIAKIIKRDSDRAIKDHMQRQMGVSTRNINGVNITQFRKMFAFEPKYQIRGEAGPGSFAKNGRNNFVIIPWLYVARTYKKLNHDETLLKIFESYAMFQKFIWKGDPWNMMQKDKHIRKFLYVN